MKPNYEYFDGGKWHPVHVNLVDASVYDTESKYRFFHRWNDSFWDDWETRPYQEKSNSPKDRQVGGDHYKYYKIQPSEFIRANNIGWYEANAIKRICRHQNKNGREDIEKAIHELEFILEEYDNKNKENN